MVKSQKDKKKSMQISLTILEKRLLIRRNKQLPKLTHKELSSWSFANFGKSVNRSTITKWIASGKYNGDDYAATDKDAMRKRTVKYPELDAHLSAWCDKYEKLAILSDGVIKEQAKIFASQLQIPETQLKLSEGWLAAFKKRNKIKKRTISGESASVNTAVLEAAMPNLLQKISEYDLSDVFNFDETALFYRLRPDKTLSSVEIKGHKKNKERITIGLCVNATGTEKLQPLIIGKHASPRCFKNINLSNLNITYMSNQNAWMTKVLFYNWLTTFDQKIKNKTPARKVLLLLDNACGHAIKNSITLSNIEIKYLPAGCTSKIQPLDAGIIASFKALYKQKFIKWLLNNSNKDTTNKNKLSLIDAVRFVSLSWDEVTKETVANCWNHTQLVKIIDNNNYSSNIENHVDILQESLAADLGIGNIMTAKEYLSIDELLADQEVKVEPEPNNKHHLNVIMQSDSSDKELINHHLVTPNTALTACLTLQEFLIQQATDFQDDIRLLRRLEAYIEKVKSKNKKQMTLDNFIKKK